MQPGANQLVSTISSPTTLLNSHSRHVCSCLLCQGLCSGTFSMWPGSRALVGDVALDRAPMNIVHACLGHEIAMRRRCSGSVQYALYRRAQSQLTQSQCMYAYIASRGYIGLLDLLSFYYLSQSLVVMTQMSTTTTAMNNQQPMVRHNSGH